MRGDVAGDVGERAEVAFRDVVVCDHDAELTAQECQQLHHAHRIDYAAL